MMLNKFASYYRPHMKIFIIDLLCAMVVATVDLIFPALSGIYVDDLIPNKNTHMMLILAAVILGMYTIRVGCNFYINYWGHVMGSRIQYDMRKELFSHLQSLPFKFFDDNKTGKIMNHMTSDLAEVSELAHHGPEDLFLSTLMLVGSFILLYMKNVALASILMFCVLLLLLFTLSRRKKVTEAFRDTRRKQAEINSQIENSISGIRLTQSFSNEEYESDKFDVANVQYRDSVKRAFKQMGIYSTGTHFLADLLGVVIIVIGGLFVAYNKMSMGELVTFLLYTSIFIRPVRRLIDFTQQLQRGMTGFERVFGILNIDPDIKDSENAKPLKNVKGRIELENVTFSYEDEHLSVLKDFSLSIEEKTTLALVGPSGVGKTTISQIIPRFYDVNQGDIKIDGQSVRDVTLSSLRKNIGIVQQDVFLFSGDIYENILYGKPNASYTEVVEAAKKANIHDFILSLREGYNTEIGERGIKLSGGQKQRLSLARMFLKNPRILILDEATSALDNTTENLIQKELDELCKNRTTIVVAHRLSTVKNVDQIIVIGKKVLENGNHSDLLLEKGIYNTLYEMQFSKQAG